MTNEERGELLGIFMAALHAVVPELTRQKRALVQQVLDGMLRERERPTQSGR